MGWTERSAFFVMRLEAMNRPEENRREGGRPVASGTEPGRLNRVRLEGLIVPTLDALGYGLVRLLVSGRHAPTLQVMAERQDGRPMGVEDCTAISVALSRLFDAEDPVSVSYTLEVSSPGLDRPLTKAADYDRFKGRSAKIETYRPLNGRRRFQGKLVGAGEGQVRLDMPEGTVTIALDDIARAKLIIDDAFLRDSLRGEADPAGRNKKRG